MTTIVKSIPPRTFSEDRYDPEIGLDLSRQPRWNIPETIVLKAAVVGSPIKRARNLHQPYTPDEIRKEAMECIEAGAISVHIHPRTAEGNMPKKDEYLRNLHLIIDPIKEKYGDKVVIDGCTVMPNFEDELELIKEGLVEISPINLFVFGQVPPKKLVQAETEMMQERGVKPQIALYCDGDLDRAKTWLIDTGILAKPYYWILLPSYTLGGTPLPNEFAMVESLLWHVRRIREIDTESVIMVCMAGRATCYLSTLAMLMGLHVRVGMEDTYFKWPHRGEIIDSNASIVSDTIALAKILGRRLATANEYRSLIGLPER